MFRHLQIQISILFTSYLKRPIIQFVCLVSDVSGGAACCSGDGDFILKFCPAFQVVQLLKQVGGAACCSDGDFILKF